MIKPVENQAISSVLAQMRQVAQNGAIQKPLLPPGISNDVSAQVTGQVNGATQVQKSDFAQLVSGALESVSQTQAAAGARADAFERGDPNTTLSQVVIALEKASVSFEGVKQVRNRLVAAYQEIMNMPV